MAHFAFGVILVLWLLHGVLDFKSIGVKLVGAAIAVIVWAIPWTILAYTPREYKSTLVWVVLGLAVVAYFITMIHSFFHKKK